MIRVLIIFCSGTYNRGTEALVRGTIEILSKSVGENNLSVTLASSVPWEDEKLNIPFVKKYIRRLKPVSRFSYVNIIFRLLYKVGIKTFDFSELLKEAQDMDLVLNVGADNYDVAYNLYDSLHYLSKKLNSLNAKTVLYDCSIDEKSVNQKFISEIDLYDAFSVRESITMENIRKRYSGNKLHYYPDPAFVMAPIKVDLPDGWLYDKMIGINLSTLIVGMVYGEGLKEKAIRSYRIMIDNILSKTDNNIVLIPHVMRGKDLKILEEIYEYYQENERVLLISDEEYSAPQLKYIISKCRFFVGARTHATIAAYSSCVPTLVIGYSVKSKGIACDIFGTDKDYVIPVQSLEDEFLLWNTFKKLYDQENVIKQKLEAIMPGYIKTTYKMGQMFKTLLNI